MDADRQIWSGRWGPSAWWWLVLCHRSQLLTSPTVQKVTKADAVGTLFEMLYSQVTTVIQRMKWNSFTAPKCVYARTLAFLTHLHKGTSVNLWAWVAHQKSCRVEIEGNSSRLHNASWLHALQKAFKFGVWCVGQYVDAVFPVSHVHTAPWICAHAPEFWLGQLWLIGLLQSKVWWEDLDELAGIRDHDVPVACHSDVHRWEEQELAIPVLLHHLNIHTTRMTAIQHTQHTFTDCMTAIQNAPHAFIDLTAIQHAPYAFTDLTAIQHTPHAFTDLTAIQHTTCLHWLQYNTHLRRHDCNPTRLHWLQYNTQHMLWLMWLQYNTHLHWWLHNCNTTHSTCLGWYNCMIPITRTHTPSLTGVPNCNATHSMRLHRHDCNTTHKAHTLAHLTAIQHKAHALTDLTAIQHTPWLTWLQ